MPTTYQREKMARILVIALAVIIFLIHLPLLIEAWMRYLGYLEKVLF
jgi:hypothetical protein